MAPGSGALLYRTEKEAGVVAFQWGFDAWREVVSAQGIEPSEETHG